MKGRKKDSGDDDYKVRTYVRRYGAGGGVAQLICQAAVWAARRGLSVGPYFHPQASTILCTRVCYSPPPSLPPSSVQQQHLPTYLPTYLPTSLLLTNQRTFPRPGSFFLLFLTLS
jgi:hypothetical protein